MSSLVMCLDKSGYQITIFFLFPDENICYRYSLETPYQASNEYPQHNVFVKK